LAKRRIIFAPWWPSFCGVVKRARDTQGPSVTTTVPSAKARGVNPGANVTATFSEDLLDTSINDQTFQLFKKRSTTPLGAAVIYDEATDVATLDPLQSGATYKAVVSTGVRDVLGN
jgi:hypothetical protein